MRDQCADSGTAYLHKQNGEWLEVEAARDILGDDDPRISDAQTRRNGRADLMVQNDTTFVRVGKKAAGRTLNGVIHNGFPNRTTA